VATRSQFEKFLVDIEPSATTKKNASSAHTKVRDHLAEDVEYSKLHVKTYLSGSYKRDTAIRPRIVNGELEKPDVDIIVLTSHTLSDSVQDVIDLVFRALDRLKKKDDTILSLRRQGRSVGVKTTLVDMDVVPIIAPWGENNKLYIANRELPIPGWLETNPPRHTTWTTEQNEAAGGRFKPLVKMMKWWRRENKTVARKPKGFMIECIVAECMNKHEENWAELFVGTLESIVKTYATFVGAKGVPPIKDPGVSDNIITSRVTPAAFEGFYNKAKCHAELGRRAMAETDADKELELWREILGVRFPPAAMQRTAELLDEAESISLQFPNKKIQPNKPTGFA